VRNPLNLYLCFLLKLFIALQISFPVYAQITLPLSTKDDEIKIANEYFNNGEFEKAKISYEKLAKNNDHIPLIYKNYLSTLNYLKLNEQSEKFIKRAIKVYPDNILYKADHYFLIQEIEGEQKSEKEFQSLLNPIKNDPLRVEKLSEYFIKNGQVPKAKQILITSRKALNEKNLYALALARIYKIENKPELIIEELLYYVKEDPTVLERVRNTFQNTLSSNDLALLETALYTKIQKDPDEITYNELLLWLNIQQKNFSKALMQAKAIDKRNKRQGDKVIEVGKIALENKDYENATKYFQYVVSEYPYGVNKPLARKYLINSKEELIKSTFPIDLVKIRSLVKDYNSLIKESANSNVSYEAMRSIAQIEAFYLDNKDTAIIILYELLKSRADERLSAAAKLDLGDIYLLKGEPWEATLIYSQVEKSQKDEPLGHEAKLRNAKLSYYTGDFKLAQDHLDVLKLATTREIANDAMDLSILIQDNMALDTSEEAMKEYAGIDLLLFQNKDAEALTRLDTMLKKYPNHSLSDEILFLKYKIFKRMGKFPEAVKNLDEISSKYPNDILGDDALFYTGLIYEENLNNKEKAMEIYQSFLLKYPGSIYTAEARKRFRLIRGDKLN
jgi:tetratricopeptide (TPR) repeat protein